MKPIRLPIVNVDKRNNAVMVESQNGKFPVKVECSIEDARLGDDAVVTKSAVTGEWLMIDYKVDTAVNYTIHNSMQTNRDELIVDEDGVPYGY